MRAMISWARIGLNDYLRMGRFSFLSFFLLIVSIHVSFVDGVVFIGKRIIIQGSLYFVHLLALYFSHLSSWYTEQAGLLSFLIIFLLQLYYIGTVQFFACHYCGFIPDSYPDLPRGFSVLFQSLLLFH